MLTDTSSPLARYCRSGEGLGHLYRFLPRTGSTNDVARRLAEGGAAAGLVVVADEQTAGRGRFERRWVAPPGTSLLLSVLFRPPAPFFHHASRTTMVCGLAMMEAVRAVAGLDVCLKWPNDLIVTAPGTWRKLSGMLSEIGTQEGEPSFLVVGLGLNVNVSTGQLARLSPRATSLLHEVGHTIPRVDLLDAFLRRAEQMLSRSRAGWDPHDTWRAEMAWLGEQVTVHKSTFHTSKNVVTGVMEDVTENGALLLRLPDGSLRSFPVGDVSLRPR
jgi:BirA family biotin operon repressor/biotin-[acetyl-CoA-carboxylase] ligase